MLQMRKRVISSGVGVVIAAAAIGGLAVSPAFAATRKITTVLSLGSQGYPQDIVEGGGDMWITQPAGNEIGRVSLLGKLTEFSAFPPGDTAYSTPHDIVLGPDGNLWYLASGDNSVGYINDALERITPSGQVTEFPLGDIGITGSGTVTLAVADQELWLANGDNLFVFTTSGSYVATYTDTTGTGAELIPAETLGPDGNIWYWATNTPPGAGTVNAAGFFNRYADGNDAGDDGPRGQDHTITTGPDGNIWMTDFNANEIIRTTPAGGVTPYGVTSGVGAITGAADGNLYFVESAQPANGGTVLGVGRITTSGVVTNIPTPQNGTASTGPYSDITSGPYETVWFVGQGNVYRFYVGKKK